ncbi:MAG: endolytic transglycosylase MltG [Firmicutes bacterium]|nr:endolytic transglycosylase MltG [Bacillota bacterium]
MGSVKRRILITVVSIFLLISFFSYWAYNRLYHYFYSPSLPVIGKQVSVDIPLGSSTTAVGEILEKENIIPNSFLFRVFVHVKGLDGQLKAGRYSFSPFMSLNDIVHLLTKGVLYSPGLRFTMPEGVTIDVIQAILEEKGLVTAEQFKETVRDEKWAKEFAFLPSPDSQESISYLEGYLFPDTYEVAEGASCEDIVRLMLKQFEKVYFPDFDARAKELQLSVHQVVTLASIIEREGKVDEERPIISSVFHNRLFREQPMLLQSCATVQYALGETKPVLTEQDLAVDSPYNTYLYAGLPPGPIGAPGRASLEAALFPANTDYLYFVSKEDGSGSHYFSTTLEEHNRYKDLVRKNRQ